MKFSDVAINKVTLSSFEENAYVVRRNESANCVVIDPGMEPEPLISYLHANNLNPKALLVTHGHWDHIGGIPEVKKDWPDVSIVIGKQDRSKLLNPDYNLSSAFGFPSVAVDADKTVSDSEIVEAAGLKFKVFETPGHSGGHVVFLLETEERPVLFCGDLLFAGSVGRTDFFDGSSDDLIESVKNKILPLPDMTLICPGHGPSTSLLNEKRYNPYLQ